MRKVTLYMVVLKESPTKLPRFYCITSTKEDAEEYVEAITRAENLQHFLSWCELHDKKSETAWEEYSRVVIGPYRKYGIIKMQYKVKDIASLFRMYNKCVPLGCSFEDSMELPCFIEGLPQELKDKLNDIPFEAQE